MKRKGFSYHVSTKQIEEYSALPVHERLRWLEQANRFTAAVLPKETRPIWERFRRGEL